MNYPKLVSKLHTPKMVWYQTDITVVIRILLQDVGDYFLHVECDHLLFSTTINSKHYYIVLYLFGTVVAEKTTHINKEREIQITLIKAHKWTEWLRLHIDKEKNPLITVDPDRLFKNNWTLASLKIGEKESLEEYKRRNNIVQIMPDVPTSDEEESDDEVMDRLFL